MFSAQKCFGQVWENSGKIISHPQNLPAPPPMSQNTLTHGNHLSICEV